MKEFFSNSNRLIYDEKHIDFSFKTTVMAGITKIENSNEDQYIPLEARVGDMLEFVRGIYSHWAIYISK